MQKVWLKGIHTRKQKTMFENFVRFFSSERNKERVIAIAVVGMGIILLNKAGLYGETNFLGKAAANNKENKKKR
jgi:hypothetical protein